MDEDVLENLVIDHQMGREEIRFLGLAPFFREMEQAGIVAGIGGAEEFQQARIGLCAVGDAAELVDRRAMHPRG